MAKKRSTKRRPATRKPSARKKATRRAAPARKKKPSAASRKAVRSKLISHFKVIEKKIKRVEDQAFKALAKMKRDYDKAIRELQKDKNVVQRELKRFLKQDVRWDDIKKSVSSAARDIDKAINRALAKIK